MNKETFDKIINKLKSHHENCIQINLAGIDLINFNEDIYSVVSELLLFSFGEDAKEIIEWYLYEYREGKMQIMHPTKEEVMYDLDKDGELWRFVVESRDLESKK